MSEGQDKKAEIKKKTMPGPKTGKVSKKGESLVASAKGIGLSISLKQAVEISKHIRGKNVKKAKNILEQAIQKKRAIPITRFHGDVGHKKGMTSGRYFPKSCGMILNLIRSAESNAEFKGMSTASLVISEIRASTASRPWRYGRQRRIKQKRAHVYLELKEAGKNEEKQVRVKNKPVTISKTEAKEQSVKKEEQVKKNAEGKLDGKVTQVKDDTAATEGKQKKQSLEPKTNDEGAKPKDQRDKQDEKMDVSDINKKSDTND